MEDISRNLEKDLIPPAPQVQDKKNRHWQILFIDDRGRIIPIRQFKALAVVSILLLTVSMIFAITFFIMFINNRDNTISAQSELALSKDQVTSLQHEVDILTARLVLTESKNKNEQKDKKTKKTPLRKKADIQKRASPKKEIVRTSVKPAMKKKPEKAAPPDHTGKKPSIEVRDFAFTYITYKNILRIRFIIKNIDQRIKTASGYIFILLKQNEKDPKSWLTIPSVDLVAGKPSQTGRGQYFKITHFKTVHFKLNNIENPEQFSQAQVYVFDKNGEILLKKTEPFAIKTIQGLKPIETTKKQPKIETPEEIKKMEKPVTKKQEADLKEEDSIQKAVPEQPKTMHDDSYKQSMKQEKTTVNTE